MKTAVHVSTKDVSTCTNWLQYIACLFPPTPPLPPTPPHPTPTPHPTPPHPYPCSCQQCDPNSKMTGQHSVSPESRGWVIYRWVVGLLCLPCVSLSPVHYLLMMIPIIFPSPLPPLPSLTHLPDQLRAVVSCLTGHLGSLVMSSISWAPPPSVSTP